MNRIVLFIERLYNTIRYNGFYITLSLLFPYIIWKLDAGKEIIKSMAENAFSLNIALSLLSFSTLCLSIWCIPTLAIHIFQFVTTWSTKHSVKQKDPQDEAVRNCLYRQLVNIYNGEDVDPAGCNAGDNLPMVTCVNQSQAFPILSAYNYVDCVGRLGDGGISENSGCATTLEIYQRLRKYCDSTRKRIRIVCLNITNGNLDSNFKVTYNSRASIFNTVTAAVNSPFDGSETYAYKNLGRQVNFLQNRDTVINCSLNTSITLTRTLSKQSVGYMLDQMERKHFTLP